MILFFIGIYLLFAFAYTLRFLSKEPVVTFYILYLCAMEGLMWPFHSEPPKVI